MRSACGEPARERAPDPARPIGVFDSGMGGLSVLRRIRAELPAEDLFYVADSGHAPYGGKSLQYIERRCLAIGDFLVERGIKALVVACNTATAAAVATLRARYAMPVVGVEPAVKPAVERTRSGVVGVLATASTVQSARLAGLIGRFAGRARVVVQPCPGLVERIESGDLAGAATRRLVENYVGPLLREGADTLVLGCTHYPLIEPLIRAVAGPDVHVLETGPAVSRQLVRRLTEGDLLHGRAAPGVVSFWSSDEPARAERLIGCLWPGAGRVNRLPGG